MGGDIAQWVLFTNYLVVVVEPVAEAAAGGVER